MHFILTPIYFLLHVWAANVGEVDLLLTLLPIAVLLAVSIFLRIGAGFCLEKYSANILITCFWWLFFTYGLFYSSVKEAVFSIYPKLEFQGDVASDLPVILLVLEIGILAVLFRLLSAGEKSGSQARTLATVNSFLNGMTTFLVVTALWIILSDNIKSFGKGEGDRNQHSNNHRVPAAVDHLPDVYHLIVDGYGRQDMLVKYFGYDNSSLVNVLEGQGFAVVKDSWANYSITQASLASTLNLDYFENILQNSGNTPADGSSVTRGFVTSAIRNNRLIREMKQIGYHYLHVGSIWEATIRNPNADHEFGCSRFNLHNEFIRALVARSWLAPFEQMGGASIARCHQRMFANLADIARGSGYRPYYVFAHVVLPHYPYVFNSDCSVKSQVEMSNAFSLRKELWSDAVSYIAQIDCVNLMLVNAIKTIIAHDPNSWIVIHSDHGPDIPRLDDTSRISARLANFIAIRAPEGRHIDVDFHSPIAVWRKIVGLLTGTDMSVQERYFYIPDNDSGSIKYWKEFTIEELEKGAGGL